LIRAPETPRFLFKIGRKKEGLALLARIMDAKEAAIEAAEIEASLVGASDVSEPLTSGPIRRIVLISFALAVLIQVSGINTIIDYAPLVLRSAGWKIDAALFSTFIIGGINFAFTLISFWTIDRYGRKPLYTVGSLGMTAALALIIGMLAAGRFNGGIVVGLMALFIAFFASCIGPVFWTLVPEIFPNKVRGRAMVVPVVTQWVANAFVVLLFPLAFNQFLQALFTLRFLPETKGKTLEEIEDYWSGKRTISELRG
jgi:SP family arabinose:H+ symporter-like MFS transporter